MRSRAFVRLAFGLLPAVLAILALAVAALGGMVVAADTTAPLSVTERDGVGFVDARELGIEGRGWPAADFAAPFDRLPARPVVAQNIVVSGGDAQSNTSPVIYDSIDVSGCG